MNGCDLPPEKKIIAECFIMIISIKRKTVIFDHFISHYSIEIMTYFYINTIWYRIVTIKIFSLFRENRCDRAKYDF